MFIAALAPLFIKALILSTYNPAEDLTELGVTALGLPIKALINKYTASVEARLKTEFSPEQIRMIKAVLKESDDRLIISSAHFVYENVADVMALSQVIFVSYRNKVIKQASTAEGGKSKGSTEYNLYNDEENKQLVKGISIIIREVVDICLLSPEYIQLLTEEQIKILKAVEKNAQEIQAIKDWLRVLEERIQNLSRPEEKYIPTQGSFADNHPDKFFGREEKIEEVLLNIGKEKVILVSGEGGIGKTEFCREVLSRAQDAGTSTTAVSLIECRTFDDMMRRVAGQYGIAISPTDKADQIERIVLEKAEGILYLDNFEDLISDKNTQADQQKMAVSFLRKCFDKDNVTVLISSRDKRIGGFISWKRNLMCWTRRVPYGSLTGYGQGTTHCPWMKRHGNSLLRICTDTHYQSFWRQSRKAM